MNATTSDGVRIDYSDSGQGEPALVLCPAWCMSRNGFADLSDKLLAIYRALPLDWRGHGDSEKPEADFGAAQLVDDVLAVVEAAGIDTFIPVTMSHSGWVAVEIRKRLGAARVPKIVHLDWVVLPPPPMYMDLVHGLADPDGWQQARDVLFNIWLEGVDNQDVISFVRDEMGSYDGDMWMRSGREIAGCYERGGFPLKALSELDPPAPTLHIYSQPPDEGYYQAQVEFGQANGWYQVHRLAAHSHFPTFELSDEIAGVIEDFVGRNEGSPTA